MKKKAARSRKSFDSYAFVVAGGSNGLGRATALEAALKGYPVALIGRNLRDLQDAKDEILTTTEFKVEVSIHQCDLTKSARVEAAFKKIKRIHGGARVLVNSAATWIAADSVEETSSDDIRKSLELNFFSAYNATRAFLKYPGREPAIINIGATASLQGWPSSLAFSIGKGALRTYSQALARELDPIGIHVAHIIVDGLIDNKRTRKLNKGKSDNEFISMKSLANEIIRIAQQERSCWTFELDVRPYNENW